MQIYTRDRDNAIRVFCRYIQLDPSRAARSNGAPPAPKLTATEQTASNDEWDAAIHVRLQFSVELWGPLY